MELDGLDGALDPSWHLESIQRLDDRPWWDCDGQEDTVHDEMSSPNSALDFPSGDTESWWATETPLQSLHGLDDFSPENDVDLSSTGVSVHAATPESGQHMDLVPCHTQASSPIAPSSSQEEVQPALRPLALDSFKPPAQPIQHGLRLVPRKWPHSQWRQITVPLQPSTAESAVVEVALVENMRQDKSNVWNGRDGSVHSGSRRRILYIHAEHAPVGQLTWQLWDMWPSQQRQQQRASAERHSAAPPAPVLVLPHIPLLPAEKSCVYPLDICDIPVRSYKRSKDHLFSLRAVETQQEVLFMLSWYKAGK